ncbi:amino acid adenylation domain-containing protein [Streptosporangium sp. NPDC048047]|uniref:amino acid adenylation domain-containing protein n=1 Tax=Streptosporangium sp. NPDC048047 TaxID=3155748 RepID=UPI003433D084
MRAPLSPAQERLWLLQRLTPGDASYVMYLVRRLRGPLDTAALTAAFADVVARHESLRTRFEEEDGVPWAVSSPAAPTAPSPVTPQPASPAAPPIEWAVAGDPGEAERMVAERVNAPFDLAGGPPVRIAVIRLAGDDHVLCLTLHHIIADGWSLNVLLDDLSECYTARSGGREPRLRPLAVQPSDHARWQRHRAERAVPYWRGRLADPPVPELPFGLRPDPGGSGAGVFHTVRVPAAVTARLDRLAQEHRTTLFAVLLAAYQVLLLRHTGRTDVLVGSVAAARDRVGLEPLVGYLAQTVVLRGDLSGDPPFTGLLARTRGEAMAALGRTSVPFERLGHPPETLMPTMFIMHNHDDGTSRPFGGLAVEPFDAGYRQVKAGLLVEVWRDSGGLTVSLCHDSALAEPRAGGRLADRYLRLLESVSAGPAVPLSRLGIWTAADEEEIHALADGDGTGETAEDGIGKTAGDDTGETAAGGSAGDGAGETGGRDAREAPLVPEMIADAVRRAPGAVAVVCGRQEVTYGELDAMAARLAAALLRHGVRPGDVVGVRLPRSAWTVAAPLAVWRAGAAYLPLDPDHPGERAARALAGAGAVHLITHDRAPEGVTAIDPSAPGNAGDVAPAGPATPAGTVTARDACYVISTSGSTGVPKSVVVEHGAVAARVRWMRAEYGLTAGDGVVQFASLAFDTHVEEIFPALAAGSALILLPDGAATLPDLLTSPRGGGVTVLDLPTAYWHSLVEDLDDTPWPPALRLVILGGEQVAAAAVRRWRTRFGDGVRLLNTYGPTEGTVIATMAELGAEAARGHPPIGRPIGATSVRVVDEHGEALPPGAAGELVIGGAGVARGYLGRPAPTADRFVPDPHGGPGSRRYRTGDRGRLRADGRLEFLGRLDDQLKVRGFRIEPGEVEGHLCAHPGVGQASVTARGDDLVAYVTGTATPADLRAHLERFLPRQLLPTVWVRLEALPLTTGGKVDRAALPPPPDTPAGTPPGAPAGGGRAAPGTDAERLVAGIWCELLGLEEVGVHDDFLALGGHSLLATRVAARLRRATGIEVPIRLVFAGRTVAELAAAVEEFLISKLDEMSDEEALRVMETR